MIYIYYLYIEGEDKPFYVGKTNRKQQRLNEHISHSKEQNTIKANKIKKALSEGKKILLKEIAKVETDEEANIIEISLIKFHGRLDKNDGILANHTDGRRRGSWY